jgi:hypothetical protein
MSSTLSRLRTAAKFDPRDDASDEIDLVQSHYSHANALMMRPDQGESWSKAVAGPEVKRVPARNEHSIAATRTWTVTHMEAGIVLALELVPPCRCRSLNAAIYSKDS